MRIGYQFNCNPSLVYPVFMKILRIALLLITFSHARADMILCAEGFSYDGKKCTKISEILAKLDADCEKGVRHACEQKANQANHDKDVTGFEKYSARYNKLSDEECNKGDAHACYDISRFITNFTCSENFAKRNSGCLDGKKVRTKEEEKRSYDSMVRACEIASFASPYKQFYCKQANDIKKYSNDDWIENDCKSGESSYACQKIWSDLRNSTYPESMVNDPDKSRLAGKTLRTAEQKKKMRWAIERSCALVKEKKERIQDSCKYLEWEIQGIE